MKICRKNTVFYSWSRTRGSISFDGDDDKVFTYKLKMIYENAYAYFIWKPAWLPSTRWEKPCLLTQLEHGSHGFHGGPDDHRMWTTLVRDHIRELMNDLSIIPVKNTESVCHFLLHSFSRNEEYGLLNRLDTPTSWFLYFAKSRDQYSAHKVHQAKKRVRKHYIAQVHWDIRYQFDQGEKTVYTIDYPLMHHAHLDDRMVAIAHESHRTTWRWNPQESLSKVHMLSYHDDLDHSIVHVVIHQWRRHQIRAHTWWAWYPIVGDSIYGRKHHGEKLHLWSIGCDFLDDLWVEPV